MSVMAPTTRWTLAVLLAMGLSSGCGEKKEAVGEPTSGPLAKVGGVAITEEDYAFEVQRRVDAGRPIGEPKAILNDLIERQVMLQKAEASGVLQDPQVQRELENKRLGQWLDRSLQIERDAVNVTVEELRAHYDGQLDSFTRPEMVRLAILYRKVNARDPEDTAASLAEELGKGRAAYLADPGAATQNGRIPGFGTIAAEYSEDTISRYRGGDQGWLDASSAPSQLPPEVVTAGRELEVGGVSDVLIAGDGVYVVMKSDRRPPQVTSFDEAAPGLRRKLIRLKQQEVEQNFMSNVMAGARIEINQEKAARLVIPQTRVPEPPALRPVTEMAPQRETSP